MKDVAAAPVELGVHDTEKVGLLLDDGTVTETGALGAEDDATVNVPAEMLWVPITRVRGPVVAPFGMLPVSEVWLELVTTATFPLKTRNSSVGSILKFVPDNVTGCPTAPVRFDGDIPVTVAARIVNGELVALPFDVDTVIPPVCASAGTITVNTLLVADVTVADVVLLLKPTAFAEGVVENPDPLIVIVSPMTP